MGFWYPILERKIKWNDLGYLIWFSIMGMVWLVEASLQAGEDLDQKPTWKKVQGVLEKPPSIYVKHWHLTWSAYLSWKVASIHEVGKVRTRSANGSISIYQYNHLGCKQHLFEITEMTESGTEETVQLGWPIADIVACEMSIWQFCSSGLRILQLSHSMFRSFHVLIEINEPGTPLSLEPWKIRARREFGDPWSIPFVFHTED